ncbi:aspartate kinase [Piedraia hortae CBS 480.64]|uniref:Aspartokinase n=1 Tax=Piedraia hortae CBS 480.64 TaxID=1314780 RepID=A0A6A7C731_9PEZI|nr:aspartate kinase [Piedraia hortae CBS 480.64]
MEFPIIRREKEPEATYTNGPVTSPLSRRIVHSEERDLPGGANWTVQKFGGTSVGKVAVDIAENIVIKALQTQRIAVVCSARSTGTKAEGTTNRLLRAARHAFDPTSTEYESIVEAIQADHLAAGERAIRNEAIRLKYAEEVRRECAYLKRALVSAQFLRAVTNQTTDMVIGVGEKLSCQYMTAILQDRGVKAEYIDLSEIVNPKLTKVNDQFYKDLAHVLGTKILSLDKDAVPVVTGYFGNVPGGLLEKIGRGYTDLCAALLAVGVNASELQIWKEVDGIFTADPRKVPTARLLSSVTPSEAAELTFYGSEVIHPFTMDQVIKASIPIRIKNVFNPRGEGTTVFPDPVDDLQVKRPGLFRNRSVSSLLASPMKSPKRPTAVTIKPNIIVMNVHSKRRTRAHGFLMSIFSTLDRHGLSVDLISSSEVHVSMALHSEGVLLSGQNEEEVKIESENLKAAVDELAAWGDVDLVGGMAIISLVGRQLRSMVGISGRFFSALGDNGINIEMISQGASEINISCVIEEREAIRALNVVHTHLFTFLQVD